MTQATETKAKKPHVLTENQKKVLRVLADGASRTKDDFLAAGVTQYIKGVRALAARKMVWSNDGTHYRITGPGMTALREADGVLESPVDAVAETQVIELVDVTHPLLEGSDVIVTSEPAVIEPSAAPKKVSLSLVGLDGNAFNLMGKFAAQARKEGWSNAEIQDVLNDAMDGDYQHLLRALASRCESPAGEGEAGDDCGPGDPMRQVEVWPFREEMGSPPETKWVATVDLVHGRQDTVHTTAGFDTEGEAKREAIAWAEANKYEVV